MQKSAWFKIAGWTLIGVAIAITLGRAMHLALLKDLYLRAGRGLGPTVLTMSVLGNILLSEAKRRPRSELASRELDPPAK